MPVVIFCKECGHIMYLHVEYRDNRDWWICKTCGCKKPAWYELKEV